MRVIIGKEFHGMFTRWIEQPQVPVRLGPERAIHLRFGEKFLADTELGIFW
jgi:hypothetical protein